MEVIASAGDRQFNNSASHKVSISAIAKHALYDPNWNNYNSLFQVIQINRDILMYQEYCLSSGQVISEVIPKIGSGPLICNPLNVIYTSSLVKIIVTEPNG